LYKQQNPDHLISRVCSILIWGIVTISDVFWAFEMSNNQPIPLLYAGQAGTYFGTEYDGLPQELPESVKRVGQQLIDRGLVYLGKLTCSQFSNVDLYAYHTTDQTISVSLMTTSRGLAGIDCVSHFADGSFLTTSTTQVSDAYQKQGLFRVSYPGYAADELLTQHQLGVTDFAVAHGAVGARILDLGAIAQLIDEYTLRQQSNQGHGILQFLGGLAQATITNMFSANAQPEQAAETDWVSVENEDEEYEDDEEEDGFVGYEAEQESPLIQAILRDNIASVQSLLMAGAVINPDNWHESVPLVAAVYQGNLTIIQCLIDAGANLDQLDFEVNARPLGMAIQKNRLDLMKLLLTAGVSPEGGDMETTALGMAVDQQNLEMLNLLLDAGADPNSGMEDDYRVIMSAALNGNLAIVQLLVERGADVSAWSQGETAIMSAARVGNREIYNYLYPLVDDETQRYATKHGQEELTRGQKQQERAANKLNEKLGDAALYGKTQQIKRLLENGAEANCITECGKSPLMLAAMYGHQDTLKILLGAGADPNLGGDEQFEVGQTALMYIASGYWANNRAEVIRFLVEHGANINHQDAKGRTALMLAGDFADSVTALLEAGADPDILDNEGNTALMKAPWSIQQLLLRAGASQVGMQDVTLMEAASDGNLSKVQQLLTTGANINYGDGAALNSAAQKGNLELIDLLLQAGADANLGWKSGFTPIATAAYAGYLQAVERLLTAGANPFQRCHDDEYYDALDYARMGLAEGHHPGMEHVQIIALLENIPKPI
jgi:ankyrin repeat protein